jgi:hypothetical protein
MAKIKEETCYRRSLPILLHIIPYLASHNIRSLAQPRMIEVTNTIATSESQ